MQACSCIHNAGSLSIPSPGIGAVDDDGVVGTRDRESAIAMENDGPVRMPPETIAHLHFRVSAKLAGTLRWVVAQAIAGDGYPARPKCT